MSLSVSGSRTIVKEKKFTVTKKSKHIGEYEITVFLRVTKQLTYNYPYEGFILFGGTDGLDTSTGRAKTKREAWLKAYKYAKKKYGIDQ